MSPVCRLFICSLILVLASGGCSKRSERANSGSPEPEPTPAGPSAAKGRPQEQVSGPDSVLAEFRAKGVKMHGLDSDANFLLLKKLKETIPPTHPRRADAFRAMAEVGTKTEDRINKPEFLVAAASYAGKDEVPDLLNLVKQEQYNVELYRAAVKQLKVLKDPRCVPAAVEWFATREINGFNRDASELLRAIGPPAESAVQPYTLEKLPSGKYNDNIELRVEAIAILRDIGTADSLPTLNSLQKDPAPRIRKEAQAAAKAIQERAGKTKP
jgi:hypothetical protein